MAKLKKEYEFDQVAFEKLALETYPEIQSIVKKKCSDCHDSRVKLPIYGRIFPRINPVKKHQVEGLRALDMKNGFPLIAKGNPPQISLLKAIKASVIDRTMPLKSYRLVYPFRRITKKDAKVFLGWVDPLIEEHERIQEKYAPLFEANTPKGKVERMVALKCLRCHGNGNNRGGVGGFEDLEAIKKNPKLVNVSEPEKSLFYTVCKSGEMPTDPRERLTEEELDSILEWIS
ncbi:MAG: heme-binding domain-containing protein, partial [Halobacteriovoraceae bacterium]|nr:heme-binding domain-containing protein [Halobacteriovoraceae bacterium]